MKAFLALVLLFGSTGSMLTTVSGQTPDTFTGHYYSAPVPEETSAVSRVVDLVRTHEADLLLSFMYGLPAGLIIGIFLFFHCQKHRTLLLLFCLLFGSVLPLLAIVLLIGLASRSRFRSPSQRAFDAEQQTSVQTIGTGRPLYDSGPLQLVRIQQISTQVEPTVTPYQIDRSNPA